jgi:hypothetical protein
MNQKDLFDTRKLPPTLDTIGEWLIDLRFLKNGP